MRRLLLSVTLLLSCITSYAWGSSAQFKCSLPGKTYHLTLSVEEAVQVQVNDGSFLQRSQAIDIQPYHHFLLEQLIALGVGEGCARILLESTHVRKISDTELHVYFDFDRYTLRPETRQALLQYLPTLMASPEVILEGHTDNRGSEAYNKTLGLERAQSVAHFLVQQGIEPREVRTISLGEQAPKDSNNNAAGRQYNRRVEVKWVLPQS
uniref:OmpA family protein n=1 Tax=Thaumasiovibrio occultus TaxID=1891184 RepID=UPI00131C1E7A|nr:OmpA family protein [Thaumasiovibrio occultus]